MIVFKSTVREMIELHDKELVDAKGRGRIEGLAKGYEEGFKVGKLTGQRESKYKKQVRNYINKGVSANARQHYGSFPTRFNKYEMTKECAARLAMIEVRDRVVEMISESESDIIEIARDYNVSVKYLLEYEERLILDHYK